MYEPCLTAWLTPLLPSSSSPSSSSSSSSSSIITIHHQEEGMEESQDFYNYRSYGGSVMEGELTPDPPGTIVVCDDHLERSGVSIDVCATLNTILDFLKDDDNYVPLPGPIEKHMVGTRAHLKPLKTRLLQNGFLVTELGTKRQCHRRWLEGEGIEGDQVDVRVPAGVDACVSWLLLSRACMNAASMVILVGKHKDYLYPLSRLVEQGRRVLVVESETQSSIEDCRGYMTHRLLVTVDGKLRNVVEEVSQ